MKLSTTAHHAQGYARGDPSPLGIERSCDDLYFMYTGGTTGPPKGVTWSHAARIEIIGMADGDSAVAHADAVAARAARPITIPACPMMHSIGFATALMTLIAGAPLFCRREGVSMPRRCSRWWSGTS